MIPLDDAPVVVGVLDVALHVPGARSLKERRRAVVSLRDRIRARFDVSCHEVSASDAHARGRLLVTTGGTDEGVVGAVLDRIRGLVESSPSTLVTASRQEVFRWPEQERPDDPEAWLDV